MATAQEVMNDSAEGQDGRAASSRKDKERPDDKKTKQVRLVIKDWTSFTDHLKLSLHIN